MCLLETQLTANEVLRALHHDEPYLFLGSTCATVALIATGICIIRRRFDALLIYLALFAFFYGQRLWFRSEVLRLSIPPSELFVRLKVSVNYLVPIPGFLFFQAAGFLGPRRRWLGSFFCLVFAGLVLATLIFGPHPSFEFIDNVAVTLALSLVLYRSLTRRSISRSSNLSNPAAAADSQPEPMHDSRDDRAVRLGLACFIAAALWDNIVGSYARLIRIEPFAFAVFLASLGYVAARRVLNRDQELVEIHSELQLAKRIQLSILPTEFPASPHFRAAARYLPMTTVAGDFYDFLNVGPTQAGLLIADVSGHGVPAALIASMVKMAALSQSANASHPAQLLQGMNSALCGNTQDQFVTAAYVHLDANTREFRYAAAGHPAMLLLRNGNVSEVIENGFILAITESAIFTQLTCPLHEGDRLILYTDGLLEARNNQGQLFGEDNLHAIVRQTAPLTSTEAANQIVAKVETWSRSQDDDLTVIVCDFIAAA